MWTEGKREEFFPLYLKPKEPEASERERERERKYSKSLAHHSQADLCKVPHFLPTRPFSINRSQSKEEENERTREGKKEIPKSNSARRGDKANLFDVALSQMPFLFLQGSRWVICICEQVEGKRGEKRNQ